MVEGQPAESIPLVTGADGVMRVGGSRVTFDTVVAAFSEGATAEEIAQQYPTLALADVYQVIGYYLRHTSDLAAYFARRGRALTETRQRNESTWPPDGVRARLMARRQG